MSEHERFKYLLVFMVLWLAGSYLAMGTVAETDPSFVFAEGFLVLAVVGFIVAGRAFDRVVDSWLFTFVLVGVSRWSSTGVSTSTSFESPVRRRGKPRPPDLAGALDALVAYIPPSPRRPSPLGLKFAASRPVRYSSMRLRVSAP